MTRKDYVRAVNLLKKTPKKEKKIVVRFLCSFFKDDNPLFNEERFLEATKD